jgi:putative membrane protein
MTLSDLPALNATLNGVSAALICTGLVMIKKGRRRAHRNAMLAAVVSSTLFLASYLYYHFHAGTTRFQGTGIARGVYFTILGSHTVLAAAVPFLVGISVTLAVRGRYHRHRAWARWTAPIWLYVSVTGIAVYVMLYHLFPSA